MEQRSASDSVPFLHLENAEIAKNQKLNPVNQQEILDNICLQLGYPPYYDRLAYWHSVIVVGLAGLFWSIVGSSILIVFSIGIIAALNSEIDRPKLPVVILPVLVSALILYMGIYYLKYLLQLLRPYRQIALKRYEALLLKGKLTSGQIVSVQAGLDGKFRNSVFQSRGRYTISFEYGEHAIKTNYLTWQRVKNGQYVHVLHLEGLSVLL